MAGKQRLVPKPDIDADIVPRELSIENEPAPFVRGEVDVLDQMNRTTAHMDYVATSPLRRGVRDNDLEKDPSLKEAAPENEDEIDDLEIDEAALKGDELFEKDDSSH